MKIYLAKKFKEDSSDKALVNSISRILAKKNIESVFLPKDFEKWGTVKMSPQELMKLAFEQIDDSDIVLVEFSEKGVGVGIEAGYAYSKGIPVIVIAKKGSDISATLQGIAREIFIYDGIEEISSISW